MCCEKSKEDIYENTVDNSRELSLQKAIAIFMDEQKTKVATLKRPDFNPKSGALKILIALILLVVTGIILAVFNISLVYVCLLAVLILIVGAKKSVIWLIMMYQKYAPERLRKSCVYEPTCSNYMLMTIDKYGLLKGITRGTIRLFRCHPPNGGIDNP